MARPSLLCRINMTGGIVSPGALSTLLDVAAESGIGEVRFGLRQDVLIEADQQHMPAFRDRCTASGISFSGTPNITSAYVACGIFAPDSWLTEGVYKDVFDQFTWQPSLKINVCDGQQTFCPLFTGHLNWVASPQPHYWRLYVRLRASDELYCWPLLIYTNSIAAVCRELETRLEQGSDWKAPLPCISQPSGDVLELPPFRLPYYEGFNRYGQQYWLGIYRRDEAFSTAFLKDLCTVCLETGVGQFYITPWKSVIIKNIEPKHRQLWDYVLGKHDINVRHAANELNWQVPDQCEDSLVLKRHVIRHFDKEDVRTYGLSFSVQLNAADKQFGAIVIRRQPNKYASKLKYMQRYEILHTADFNPNSGALVSYRSDVVKEHLGPYLTALCKFFYQKGSEENIIQRLVHERTLPLQPDTKTMLHQCRHCGTAYDEAGGDPAQGIAPGTAFIALPDTFQCYICEAGKEAFIYAQAAAI
ncbi:rubredoxin [Chitinophaga lutea]